MEIMGQNLDLAFKELGINATKVHQTVNRDYEGEYQVWEVFGEDEEKLMNIKNEDWKDEYGWWRTGECMYGGSATVEFTVNGHKMLGYKPERVYFDDEDEELYFQTEYNCYTDWLSGAFDLGNAKNTVIFATSLAKDNEMSLAEFMKTYQG